MGNQEAIKDAYKHFTDEGYGGSITDFSTLISTNDEALSDAYTHFTSEGYGGSIVDFGELMGRRELGKSKLEETTPEETTPKESINYQKQTEIIDKAEQVVISRLMKNDAISDEERAIKLKRLEEFNAKKRAKLDADVQDQYANQLIEIANTGASDEMVEQWTEEVTTPAPQVEFSFFSPIPKAYITSPYEAFLESAEKSLKDQGKDAGKEAVKEMAIKMAIADKNTKWKANQTAEVMEQVETDFGIDRTDTSMFEFFTDPFVNMIDAGATIMTEEGRQNFAKSLSEADKKRIQDQGVWASAGLQLSRAYHGKQGEEYYDARTKIYDKVDVKQKELEKEYANQVNNIIGRGDNIKKDIEEINNYEEKFKNLEEKGERVSQQEFNDYAKLFEKVKIDRALYQKDIDDLGSKAVPSNDFKTIKNLTLKTYDNLDMVNNNVMSSVVTLGAGIGTLAHELTLPEMLKWNDLDIESEEGLTKIFGEEESTLKELARSQGKANLSMSNVLNSAHKMGTALKGQNAPVPTIGEVDSLGDFGMYMMDLASGQMVNTALTVAFPPAGLAILAAGATGGKMYEMNKEMEGVEWTEQELAEMKESGVTPPDPKYKIPPVEYNALEYFATGAMVGGAEYLTERVSLGILKGGFKNFQKAFNLSGDGINTTLKQMTTPKQLAKIGYNFGKDSFKEAGAEGIVQLTTNFADMMVLGKEDVSIMDGMTDAMAAGFFMGNMFSGPPAIASMVTTAFSSEAEFAQANKLNSQMISLSKQRDAILAKDPSDRDGAASMLQTQIEQTLDKQMESMNKVRQRTLDMTGADRQGMIDQYNKEHKLRAEIDKINENPDISKENKAILINDKVQELAESEAIRERILADATFNADIKRQSDLSTQIRAENGTLDMVEYVVADNADSALDQGLNKIDAMDLTDQQKSALKDNLTTEFNAMKAKSASGESYNGFAWGDNIQIETQKDGEMVTETLNVPMTFALNKNNATVASHELGHQTMFKQFIENNPDAVGLVDDLEAYVKKNYKKAYANFKAVRAAYETESLSQEQMAEEQLANLSDFMRMNNLQGDRTLHNKLFGRFQKVNDGNNQIETGKDVFDMLTSYNQSFETGQLQGLAKSVIKGKAKVKRAKQDTKAQQQITELKDSMAQEAKKPKGKFSKFVQGETKGERSKRQDKRNVDVTGIYKADATGKNNEQWRDFLDSPKGSRVLGDMINMYYPDMIASAINKKAADPMEVASEAIEPLMKHIQAFNPEQNTDLAGYVGGYLGLKVGTGAKRVAAKTPTISMEKEGVREVAEKQAVEETSKKEAPVRKGIKLAERLGDDAKKISEKVKKMKPVLEGKTYKTLKDLAPDDTQRMFGITPKPGNLTKADVKNAQAFIRKNADILLAMLPEGTTVGGKATGVQKVLLDAFYTKGRRVKAAKTGSKAGLATQNKKPDIKISEFLDVFGITPAGQPNVSDRNTSSRIKALVDQTGKLLTNQAIREVTPTAPKEIAEGKSKVMFSKDINKAPKIEQDIVDSGVEQRLYEDYISDQKFWSKFSQEEGGKNYNFNNPKELKEWKEKEFPKLVKIFPKDFILNSGAFYGAGKTIKTGPNKGKKSYKFPFRDESPTKVSKKGKLQPEHRKVFEEYLNENFEDSDYGPPIKNLDIALEKIGQKSKKFNSYFGSQKNIDNNLIKEKVLKEIFTRIENADGNIIPAAVGMLRTTAAEQAHFMRKIAPVTFRQLGIEKLSSGQITEEHALGASLTAKQALFLAKNKVVKDNFTGISRNYFQGPISKINDNKVNAKELGMKEGPQQEDLYRVLIGEISGWIRYAKVPGFNLNDIEILDNKGNKIILTNYYNVGVDPQYRNIPDIIALQNKLIVEQIKNGLSASDAQSQLKDALPVKIEQSKSATPANETMINSTGVMKSKDLNNEETVRQAEILDQALNIARDPNAPVKKIRVFDFDDTLARTKSNVLYTMPDGKTGKITPAEYAARGTEMLNDGAEFDFSEFNKVMDGRKGPMFKVAETIAEKRGTSDMFVLTARSADAAPAIKEFLDALGLNIPIENITGLGDSSPLAKSGWMVNKAAEGYNDFYFADDHLGNVKAVEKVMDLVDVKSKVQQAKIKFSKDVDQIFNDIIENKTGILSAKEYSAAKAKTVGAKKGRWKFWIAPSAEDFVGLLYPLLGKGKLGDTQMAWFKEHLLDPYGRAMENLSRRQNRLSNDFKALKKALVKGGSIPKNLNKKAFDKWTYQDLSRVAAWHTQGFDIPGLSKADLNEMLDFIRENPGIKTFADQLIMINKGDGYAKPGKDWLAGTISTDLLDGLRTDGRSEYLQEWKANKDLIFSEKNLNKLEAAYGPKYREALEDMLRRMETGKNRTSTGNRLENRLLDYINNSVGTVMFLNMRSGVLQTLSAVNFLNWSDNNPLKAGAAFANQPRYWKDFMKLMNSDFLVDRRNGLKINVSESEIADAARTSKNKAKAVVSYLLQKGFTVTQIMDSFAIASGGATFYRNRIKKYVKQGMTQADAEAKAYLDFREVAEESQQSARPDRISQQQASALGRVILAFANTPMQYNRIMKKAFLDLKNGRGDAKTHISKMIYYGAIQNMMFTALQQAMFAMAFDDEEEPDEVKRKKYMKMANSMMDNILRGLGIWGTAASTLINITKKAIEESQKEGYPGADYDAAAMELLNFSPPIDIKISKLRQAGSNWKYEGWKHDEAAWSMKDPAYKSAAYIISSLTNIPVDRFYKKMDNIQSALDSNNETWKRVANILGWANWELESDADRKERIADEKVRKKDVRDKKKEEAAIEEAKAKEAAMTPAEKKAAARQKKFDGYKALSKKEQVDKLLELGLTKAEIRALKYEKDRVDKLIELEE